MVAFIAALPAVMIGLMALLVMFGLIVLIEALMRILDALVGVNWFTRGLRWVQGIIQGVINTLFGWLVSIVRAVEGFITAIPRAIHTLIEQIEGAIASVASWTKWIVRTWIPSMYNWVYGVVGAAITGLNNRVVDWVNEVYRWAGSAITGLRNTAVGWINEVYRWAGNAITGLRSAVVSWINEVYRWTGSLVTGLRTAVVGWINDVYRWAGTQIDGLYRWATSFVQSAMTQAINTAIEWARRFTDQAIGALVNALAIAAALPLVPAWPRVTDAIDAIAKSLPGALADILSRLGTFPRALPRTLTGLLAAVGALAAVGVDWIKECGIPLCRRLGGFGSEIESLQDEFMIIELLEFIQAAVTDPHGSAGDAARELGTTIVDVSREGIAAIDA